MCVCVCVYIYIYIYNIYMCIYRYVYTCVYICKMNFSLVWSVPSFNEGPPGLSGSYVYVYMHSLNMYVM